MVSSSVDLPRDKDKDTSNLTNFAFNSSAMSLLEKSPDKTGREKEAAKTKMAMTVDIAAPILDNSFVKTQKADVVHASAEKMNNTAEPMTAQVATNKLPAIEHVGIEPDPVDKATIELELAALGQNDETEAVNNALDSARNDLDAVEEELKRNGV